MSAMGTTPACTDLEQKREFGSRRRAASRGQPLGHSGREAGRLLDGLAAPLATHRSSAKLPDLRIHGLRHSFASSAVTNGEGCRRSASCSAISQVQTTARYAHLADDPMRAAAGRISDTISGHFTGKQKSDATA
jgi:integrase